MTTILRHCRDFIFVCCLVGFFPYFAQSPEDSKPLKGIVGGSVTFPAPVMKTGFLLYKDLGNAAVVLNGISNTELMEQFTGRLQWDSQTGDFTITHLRTEDSGIYAVDCSDQQKKRTKFHLDVYKNMSTPTVTWLQLERNCSVLCSVENGREVTLSWQRDGEVLSHTSSPDINGSLSLPLEIDNKIHSYLCEAKNPVSLQFFLLDIPSNCTEDSGDDTTINTRDYRSFVIAMGIFLLIILMIVIYLVVRWTRKSHNAKGENTSRRDESAPCVEISHRTQESPQLDGKLTTVYDQLQLSRVHPSTVES